MTDVRIQKVMLLMLSSPHAGEIVSARDALLRLLSDDKMDIHQFVGLKFLNDEGLPNWTEIGRFCQANRGQLNPKESAFINDMAERTVWREPTEKQAKWLKSIFLRLGGKL
jgi:hypothetical protein